MGIKRLEAFAEKRKYFKKKRNNILFFVILSSTLLCILFILNSIYQFIDRSDILSFYIIIMLFLFFVFIKLKPSLTTLTMQYAYFDMLANNRGFMHTDILIFEDTFLTRIQSKGFERIHQELKFQVFYKIINQLENVHFKGKALAIIVLVYDKDVKIHSESVEQAIQKIYIQKDPKQEIQKQFILQFKQFSTKSENVLEEVEEMIMYHVGPHVLIHLNVGYFNKTNEIYTIFPIKKFPNKYMYATCQWLSDIIMIKE